MVDYTKTKVYVLSDSDQALIPEDARKILSEPMQSNDPDANWTGYKEEYKSDSIHRSGLKNGPTAGFMAVLEREMDNGYTHVALGDFKYKYNKDYQMVYRSKYNPNAGGGGSSSSKKFTPRTPMFLDEVYLGTVAEINEKIKTGDYTFPYNPIVIGDKILINKLRKGQSLEAPVSSSPSPSTPSTS